MQKSSQYAIFNQLNMILGKTVKYEGNDFVYHSNAYLLIDPF